MKNYKYIVTVFILIIILNPIHPDDGSWNRSFTIEGGSIYSEEDNGDIVLEKELLVFNGVKTRVHFLFRNTGDRRITLKCGFPVIHQIDSYRITDYLELPSDKYGDGAIPGLTYFQTIPHPDIEDEEDFMEINPYVIPVNEFNNSRNFITPSEAAGSGIDFQISRNGRDITVEKVLLERRAGRNGASLTFHFQHSLTFNPGETTTVRVEYTQDLLYGSDGMSGNSYRWQYLIGTGSTWKDPIGEFFMITPASWNGEIPGMNPVSRVPGGMNVYHVSNWEPDRDERFSLEYTAPGYMSEWEFLESFHEKKAMWIEKKRVMEQPLLPVQDFVSGIGASSSLTDKVSVFTDEGVIESAGFGPDAAFDGLAETSWCENVSGNGIGEYIEVETETFVIGIIIRNGFTRFQAHDWVFNSAFFEREIRDDSAGLKDYFNMNGRVRNLDITDSSGKQLYTLSLADGRNPQCFGGVFLEPGCYRFTITDVYPGSRWEDTCLAELTFIPLDSPLVEERFYREAFTLTNFPQPR